MHAIVRLFLTSILLTMIGTWQPRAMADDAPMTNQDVIKMVKAKLPQSTVVLAVKGAKPSFDTSADGLIKLSAAGVPQPVIEAMLQASAPPGAMAAPGKLESRVSKGAFNPEEVILVEGDQQTPMRYLTPSTHSGARALGFGGFATYAVLNGPEARLRTKSNTPSFIVEVPSNAQPESYATLANFAVRKNGSREVMVGGGYVTYESGIHRDRIVAVNSDKLADQSKAQPGFVLYTLTPAHPLPKGEYAMVLYNSAIRMPEFFVTGKDSYFDFGVN